MTAQQPLATFLEQSVEFHGLLSTIYRPLDRQKLQTRIVHILPGLRDEPIHLKLETISLGEHNRPTYQAISYTWGSLSPTKQVFLQDLPYNVTQNQYEALQRFRSTNEIRKMWMDVICINEADTAERSWQVSIMSHIYSSSEQTQVWLGELDQEYVQGFSEEQWTAFEQLYWIHNDREKSTRHFADITPKELMSHFSAVLSQDDGLVHGALYILRLFVQNNHLSDMPACYIDSNGIAQLFRPWFESMRIFRSILKKPWWKRVWTTQEALLSPIDAKVHFGDYDAAFSHFIRVGQVFGDHVGSSNACCHWVSDSLSYYENLYMGLVDALNMDLYRPFLFDIYLRRIANKTRRKLWYALTLSNQMGTMDSRDYVYGVLGLLPADSQFPVNYAASTSEVFQLATQRIWSEQQDLNILVKGSLEHENRTAGLPSWCIDWANSDTLSFRFYPTFDDEEDEVPDDLCHEFSRDCIILPAASIDSIKMVLERKCEPGAASCWSNYQIVESWISQLTKAQLRMSHELDPKIDQPDFRQFFTVVFRDTISGTNADGDVSCRRFLDSDWNDIARWWDCSTNASPNYQEDNLATISCAEARRFSLDFFLGVSDSTLAVTNRNQICMVPLTAQEGDLLFHVYDCCAPLVLRRVQQPPSNITEFLASMVQATGKDEEFSSPFEVFQIVGPCYLKGFMGSEGTSKLSPTRIALI